MFPQALTNDAPGQAPNL